MPHFFLNGDNIVTPNGLDALLRSENDVYNVFNNCKILRSECRDIPIVDVLTFMTSKVVFRAGGRNNDNYLLVIWRGESRDAFYFKRDDGSAFFKPTAERGQIFDELKAYIDRAEKMLPISQQVRRAVEDQFIPMVQAAQAEAHNEVQGVRKSVTALDAAIAGVVERFEIQQAIRERQMLAGIQTEIRESEEKTRIEIYANEEKTRIEIYANEEKIKAVIRASEEKNKADNKAVEGRSCRNLCIAIVVGSVVVASAIALMVVVTYGNIVMVNRAVNAIRDSAGETAAVQIRHSLEKKQEQEKLYMLATEMSKGIATEISKGITKELTKAGRQPTPAKVWLTDDDRRAPSQKSCQASPPVYTTDLALQDATPATSWIWATVKYYWAYFSGGVSIIVIVAAVLCRIHNNMV